MQPTRRVHTSFHIAASATWLHPSTTSTQTSSSTLPTYLSGDTDLPEAPASIPTHPSRTREVCVRPPNNPRNEGAMDAEAQTIPRTLILTRKRYSQVHLYPFQRAASEAVTPLRSIPAHLVQSITREITRHGLFVYRSWVRRHEETHVAHTTLETSNGQKHGAHPIFSRCDPQKVANSWQHIFVLITEHTEIEAEKEERRSDAFTYPFSLCSRIRSLPVSGQSPGSRGRESLRGLEHSNTGCSGALSGRASLA